MNFENNRTCFDNLRSARARAHGQKTNLKNLLIWQIFQMLESPRYLVHSPQIAQIKLNIPELQEKLCLSP